MLQVDFLDLISPNITPSLTAVTFVDTGSSHPLPPELLADVPCRLPTLLYLGWEVQGSNTVYELERLEGRVVATRIERFSSARKDTWLGEAILDHFGEEAHDW